MIQVELLRDWGSLAMPYRYQNECAFLKPSLSTCVQKLCPFARQVHTGSSVPYPGYSSCVKNPMKEHLLF